MRVLAEGLVAPEGPVVMPDGRCAVCDGPGVTVVSLDGEATRAAECGGDPNGLAPAPDGGLFVANNGRVCQVDEVPGALQLVAADGTVSTVWAGLDAPNDVVTAPDGSVWFTDPRDCWLLTELRPGRVYRLSAQGRELVHEGLDFPNGLAFAPDGRLAVVESRTGVVHELRDGTTRPWLRCPEGVPDGLVFDASGWCYVCCYDTGEILVFDADARLDSRIPVGPDAWPTNCTIHEEGHLLVTESRQGRLLAFDLGLTPVEGR